jgi:hypothetical protein
MDSYIAIGNDELDELPSTKEGSRIKCPGCGKRHRSKAMIIEKTKEKTDNLFIECTKSGKCYLVAVRGKLVTKKKLKNW